MSIRNRKRMDGVAEEVTKPVEVSRLVEPKFLTLTGRPANQVAFKVIRDDKSGEVDMTEKAPVAEATRRRRIRSTQRSSLLFIEFPEGATDDDVAAIAEDYGLEGYEVTQTADGRKCLKRSDLEAIPEDAVTVMIGDGRKAGVLRAETVAPTADTMPFIEIVAVEFDKAKFAGEPSVMEYLKRFDIDFLDKGVENTDKMIRVVRSEFAPDAEIRRVEVETGVVAVVTRAAVQEVTLVSSPFTDVVCEECYGQWGWGQLDFNAALADAEFCEAAEDATYRLRNLVENILFYSQLPVAARKELVSRAATQFSAYIGSLLDGLPAAVVLVNRSTLETKKEKQTMTQKTADNTTPAPAAAVVEPAAAAAVNAVVAAVADDAPLTVTRSELNQIVADAVAAAMAAKSVAVVEEPVQRTDEVVEPQGKEESPASSVELVAKSVENLATSMKTIVERLDALAGATTVRSDGKDSVVVTRKEDVFAGVFGGSRNK